MSGATEVLPPDVQLFEKTASAFNPGLAFTGSVPITKDGRAASTSTAKADTASEDYFVFNDVAFVDLQAYLITGLRLPGTKEKYELLYDRDIFERRLESKGQKPLYNVGCPSCLSLHADDS